MKARKLLSSDQLNKVIAMEGSPLVCDDCGKSFTDDVKLGLHHYNVHSEKPFECTHCGEKGTGVQKFQNHMRKHAQKRVNKCDMCQFETPHPGNLKRHMKLLNCARLRGLIINLGASTCIKFCALVKTGA